MNNRTEIYLVYAISQISPIQHKARQIEKPESNSIITGSWWVADGPLARMLGRFGNQAIAIILPRRVEPLSSLLGKLNTASGTECLLDVT